MSLSASSALPPATQKHGFRRFWLALRQLFHELVGAVFGILGLIWIQNALRAWVRDIPRWVVVLSLGLALLMAAFAWSSFRRARQLR